MISTLINFKEAPITLTNYKDGDIPTRENFISFIIFSFAISRGEPGIQQMYFRWVEKATNFNCQEMLDNFVEVGAFDTLTLDEQKKFEAAFIHVKSHTEKFIEDEFEDEWRI